MDGDTPYRVEVLPSAVKDTRRFPQSLLARIYTHLTALGENPFPAGAAKLKGEEEYYRIRVGQYRIIYKVDTEVHVVSIARIAHRSSVYRGL
ncbi:MAG: RelE/StbE family addiction module toxin [Candidatus Peregrinibacteria bacterium Greene0416_62]|nr:MAG: RelE/StbE family addiction module toxin [Candidatus Peregrinibacteria bacterium Greene0416_62]TSD00749.1 MAG: RelE/StbE family addiction module toxin [Candidatus Peregrinibacteria bacterium Greene1014_49]